MGMGIRGGSAFFLKPVGGAWVMSLNLYRWRLRLGAGNYTNLQKSNLSAIFYHQPHHHQRIKIVATMADDDDGAKLKQQKELIDKNKEKEQIEKLPLPPPPEKPLPGDCCGSGCVRCVWDLYYEELEDYNNTLLQHKNNNTSQSNQASD
ncbi:hypothetical protein FRX31_024107 [Thalictrum thalictroides]|uniref:Oxidoreductase-like domain-containing protein n=1 Tax=Thalictrum thalictroides TaxID=46969 RepID=A0A7J6VMH3_THATH|nr:hypothetical protein FRX31_024107 [Thalictrum thalictroides]